jgi:hypothetical protein
MNDSPASLPSREQELAWHRRLLEGDPTVSADLAAAFFEPLVQWLVRHNSREIPQEFCLDAADDAWRNLIKHPLSFDPSRGKSLFAYLCMSAEGDLRNLLQKEKRHHEMRLTWENVEQSPQAGKYLGRDDDPSLPLQMEEALRIAAEQVLPSVREGLSEVELKVLDLMLNGERKTAVFAAAYGISHLPQREQQAEIKRVKDMLKKRIERARPGHA